MVNIGAEVNGDNITVNPGCEAVLCRSEGIAEQLGQHTQANMGKKPRSYRFGQQFSLAYDNTDTGLLAVLNKAGNFPVQEETAAVAGIEM